jgi:hypothetical protein
MEKSTIQYSSVTPLTNHTSSHIIHTAVQSSSQSPARVLDPMEACRVPQPHSSCWLEHVAPRGMIGVPESMSLFLNLAGPSDSTSVQFFFAQPFLLSLLTTLVHRNRDCHSCTEVYRPHRLSIPRYLSTYNRRCVSLLLQLPSQLPRLSSRLPREPWVSPSERRWAMDHARRSRTTLMTLTPSRAALVPTWSVATLLLTATWPRTPCLLLRPRASKSFSVSGML